MAHFILEYSDNIPGESLALSELFRKLHTAAQATGIFPLKGIRSRAYACQDYRIADGNTTHCFIHLSVLIGAGRSQSEREHAAGIFFAELQNHFANVFLDRGVAMSFELKELEAVTKFNKNTIQDFM